MSEPEMDADVPTDNCLLEIGVQMRRAFVLSKYVQFIHPDAPMYKMPREKWEKMGRPGHIKLSIKPCHPNGLPWYDE